MVHDYHETVGLNWFERRYFRRYFKDNIVRLMAFRKKIGKEQKQNADARYDRIGTFRMFTLKNGEHKLIWLTRKKVDAYIREITNNC